MKIILIYTPQERLERSIICGTVTNLPMPIETYMYSKICLICKQHRTKGGASGAVAQGANLGGAQISGWKDFNYSTNSFFHL